MADETGGRVRLVASIDPAADDALTELARVRFGGVKSRALDWCAFIGAAVLADPSTYGALDQAEALAAYVKAKYELMMLAARLGVRDEDDGGKRP